MEKVNQYMIRQETMALLPRDAEDGSLQTYVIEEDRVMIVSKTPFEIIQNSCSYFGVTYAGRKRGAVSMGYKSMPPICICSELGIYFFPLMSETNRSCIWLSHSHIENWQNLEKKGVLVHLTHGRMIKMPFNVNVFRIKVMRTAQYRHQMRVRVAQPHAFISKEPVSKAYLSGELMVNERGTYFVGPAQESGEA
ncbi:competence protein ComK [Sporolactobacillus pectinivorans]|uniref:competence protein ComK n=1 Tax=Sporolactobacillus pectinivorans TaxID=1591408 RepID=UPI000C25AE84|nr:competence protein ComK [Sporolactobacillus pectinivorans]